MYASSIAKIGVVRQITLCRTNSPVCPLFAPTKQGALGWFDEHEIWSQKVPLFEVRLVIFQ